MMKQLIILQAAEIANESLSLIEEYGIIGVLVLVITGLAYVIKKLWNDRGVTREAWVKTVELKDGVIAAKDAEIKEIRQEDRALIKDVAQVITSVNRAIDENVKSDNTVMDLVKTLNDKQNEILTILKSQK